MQHLNEFEREGLQGVAEMIDSIARVYERRVSIASVHVRTLAMLSIISNKLWSIAEEGFYSDASDQTEGH